MVMMFMLTTVDFNDDADDDDADDDDAEGEDAEGENAEGEDAEDDEENDNWMQPAGSQNWAKQHVPGDFTSSTSSPSPSFCHYHCHCFPLLPSPHPHTTSSETPGIEEVNKECSPLPSIPMGQSPTKCP